MEKGDSSKSCIVLPLLHERESGRVQCSLFELFLDSVHAPMQTGVRRPFNMKTYMPLHVLQVPSLQTLNNTVS